MLVITRLCLLYVHVQTHKLYMPTAEIGTERCPTALICVAMYQIQNLMSKILTKSTLHTVQTGQKLNVCCVYHACAGVCMYTCFCVLRVHSCDCVLYHLITCEHFCYTSVDQSIHFADTKYTGEMNSI